MALPRALGAAAAPQVRRVAVPRVPDLRDGERLRRPRGVGEARGRGAA